MTSKEKCPSSSGCIYLYPYKNELSIYIVDLRTQKAFTYICALFYLLETSLLRLGTMAPLNLWIIINSFRLVSYQ